MGRSRGQPRHRAVSQCVAARRARSDTYRCASGDRGRLRPLRDSEGRHSRGQACRPAAPDACRGAIPSSSCLHGIRASNETWAEQVCTRDRATSTQRAGRGADLRLLSHARLRPSLAACEEGASAADQYCELSSCAIRVPASASSDTATAPICWGSSLDQAGRHAVRSRHARCQRFAA